MGCLALTVHKGDVVFIGETKVTFTKKGGNYRLLIDGPRSIPVVREKAKLKEPSGPPRQDEQ